MDKAKTCTGVCEKSDQDAEGDGEGVEETGAGVGLWTPVDDGAGLPTPEEEDMEEKISEIRDERGIEDKLETPELEEWKELFDPELELDELEERELDDEEEELGGGKLIAVPLQLATRLKFMSPNGLTQPALLKVPFEETFALLQDVPRKRRTDTLVEVVQAAIQVEDGESSEHAKACVELSSTKKFPEQLPFCHTMRVRPCTEATKRAETNKAFILGKERM